MLPGTGLSPSCGLSLWSQRLFHSASQGVEPAAAPLFATQISGAFCSPCALNQLQPSQPCRHPTWPAAALINSLVHLWSSVNKASNWCAAAADPCSMCAHKDLNAPLGLLGKPSPSHQGCPQSLSVTSCFSRLQRAHHVPKAALCPAEKHQSLDMA